MLELLLCRLEKPEVTPDLNKDLLGDKQPVITQEADMHHLLQQNMYKTRRIVSLQIYWFVDQQCC